MQYLKLIDSLLILLNRLLKVVGIFFNRSDDILDILYLLVLEFEFLLSLSDVGDQLVKLSSVLQIEGEVLGPCENGRVWLAVFVLRVRRVREGLLDLAQYFLVLLYYRLVTLEGDLAGAHHLLNQVRV